MAIKHSLLNQHSASLNRSVFSRTVRVAGRSRLFFKGAIVVFIKDAQQEADLLLVGDGLIFNAHWRSIRQSQQDV